MTGAADSEPDVLTHREASQLLGCDENTIRNRIKKEKRYRAVPGDARPALVYAREIREDRAELLRKLDAHESIPECNCMTNTFGTEIELQSLRDQVAQLRSELANAQEAARVLLLTDASKNDLLRQYLYPPTVAGASEQPR
ncbi:hypothetical protein [Mycobacteroides abscessus]|nr:hypothetical protein [Mycobacteroides abscessus]